MALEELAAPQVPEVLKVQAVQAYKKLLWRALPVVRAVLEVLLVLLRKRGPLGRLGKCRSG